MFIAKTSSPRNTPVPRFELEDLKKGIATVLSTWPSFLSYSVGVHLDSAELLPLWFSIEFPGPFRGLLHVRTTPELVRLLVGSQGIRESGPSKQLAFKEFRDLFASRLMAYLWSQHGTWFNTNVPAYSSQQERMFQPTAHWSYFVEDWPLEMVLWFDRDGKENE